MMKKSRTLFTLAALVGIALASSAAPAIAAPKGPTIVDVAIGLNSDGPFAGQFDTLIAAVLAANPAVLATLTGNGQFTVFAPTDAAFAAAGLNPMNIGNVPQGVLSEILLYHVARGRRSSEDVLDSNRIRTLLRGKFLLHADGQLTDTQGRTAGFVATDVPAANGVIHAIDAVVLPFAL